MGSSYRIAKLIAVFVLGASLLGACTKVPPQVSDISVQPDRTILVGETASLTVTASGTSDLTFEWSLQGPGSLASSATASVIYEAPTSPGQAIVQVKVSGKGVSTVKAITINIVQPIAASTSTPTPTLTPSATTTPIPIVTSSSTPTTTPTATPTSTATPIHTPTPTPTPPPQAEVTSSLVNVRAGPETCHPIIASASQGQTFDITGKNPDASWWQIRLPSGTTGWIYASLVETSGPIANVSEVIAPSCPPPPTPVVFYEKYRVSCGLGPHQGRRSVCCGTTSQEDPEGHGGTVGIYLASGESIDLSSATTMSVWVYDMHGPNTVELRLIDQNGCASKEFWSDMQANPNTWTSISWYLPESAGFAPDFSEEGCNTFDRRHVKSIELYEWNDGTYCFADWAWR